MGAIKDSMKIIEMSEQEIDALKTIIDELTLSEALLLYSPSCFH